MLVFQCSALTKLFVASAVLRRKPHGFCLRHYAQRLNFGSIFSPYMSFQQIARIIISNH
ncbi:UNVERIFIED_CONTAM: hypothetical protein GTU68_026730 [Idotea baltica]|nr:hypothetical protein [Idotea baltica]